jgi:hypothetical protein
MTDGPGLRPGLSAPQMKVRFLKCIKYKSVVMVHIPNYTYRHCHP